MLNRVRDKLGLAGLIVAVVALAAALGGSAVAANSGDGATASAKNNRKGGNNVNKLIKREARKFSKVFSQRFSKRFPGPIGPRGFPGLPGAPGEDGDDGDDGDDGSNGSNGTNGKSVAVSAAVCGGLGGAEVKVEGAAEGVEVCNGEEGEPGEPGPEGSPWTELGTLPTGETLTGTWGAHDLEWVEEGKPGSGTAVVSLPLPTATAPELVFVKKPGEEETGKCPGLVEGVPTAEEGVLCVYAGSLAAKATFLGIFNPTNGKLGSAARTGTVLFFSCEGASCLALGTWAVTGN